MATGVFTAINVAFNNSSLVYLSLSMNQVITASMPVLTCCFAVCIEKVRSRVDDAGPSESSPISFGY